jgi:hypothetical protein
MPWHSRCAVKKRKQRKENRVDSLGLPGLLARTYLVSGWFVVRSKQGRVQLGNRRLRMPIYSFLLKGGGHESAKTPEATI